MRALVTGGTKGVGFEIVKSMVQNNIPTLFTGRDSLEIREAEIKQNEIQPNFAKGIELDFSNMNSIQNFLKTKEVNQFQPNILVHNAGYLSIRPYEKPINVQKLFLVNAIGPIILTQHFLPSMIKNDNGHIFFNAPPLNFDKKVKFLTPYLQSKFAQTTYMKSLAYILHNKNISANTVWTSFPLWTDAISKRGIGKKEDCMHPSIVSRVMEEIMFEEDPLFFKGNEIIDEEYLVSKGIPLSTFALGQNSGIHLDDLFLQKLKQNKV